jgi:hypothetical protein
VPAVDDALTTQIDDADGVARMVLPVHGFAEGAPATYWDFGTVPGPATMPMYFLCRASGVRCLPVEHAPIAEALPGEDGYAHFGRVHEVEVTDAWDGEILPSREAIDDAVRDGLVLAPVATDEYAHCPIVHPEVRVGLDDGTTAAPEPIYVRGMEARCVAFWREHGFRSLADPETGRVLVRNVYPLFREGDALPISEIAREMDLTGDGDQRDTNNVLGVAYTSSNYTPLWRAVRVVVPATYASIDTSMDETMATYRAATDMFTIDPATYELMPIPGAIVEHEITETWIDCPIQSEPGAL